MCTNIIQKCENMSNVQSLNGYVIKVLTILHIINGKFVSFKRV